MLLDFGRNQVYSVSGQLPYTQGRFVRLRNPRASDRVDRVVIRLTQPVITTCQTCSNNPMGLDNIVTR